MTVYPVIEVGPRLPFRTKRFRLRLFPVLGSNEGVKSYPAEGRNEEEEEEEVVDDDEVEEEGARDDVLELPVEADDDDDDEEDEEDDEEEGKIEGR